MIALIVGSRVGGCGEACQYPWMRFGDFIVYVDESGDHGLKNIDPQHPVFTLALCIVDKATYTSTIVPAFQNLKFEFFGHDAVVLHSHHIRKAYGDFNVLQNATVRKAFVDRLTGSIGAAPFTVIASVIDKSRHVRRYVNPVSPYTIALEFCVERLQRFLSERGQTDRLTHVIVESRGKSEDKDLELEFRRICDGAGYSGQIHNLAIRFMAKNHNSTGLQLADLVAHPIGRHVMAPNQLNRAYDVVMPKFRRGPGDKIEGYGLKIFP